MDWSWTQMTTGWNHPAGYPHGQLPEHPRSKSMARCPPVQSSSSAHQPPLKRWIELLKTSKLWDLWGIWIMYQLEWGMQIEWLRLGYKNKWIFMGISWEIWVTIVKTWFILHQFEDGHRLMKRGAYIQIVTNPIHDAETTRCPLSYTMFWPWHIYIVEIFCTKKSLLTSADIYLGIQTVMIHQLEWFGC